MALPLQFVQPFQSATLDFMPVAQRAERDCGVAALANYAELSYEDVYVAAARVETSQRGKGGLHNKEIVAIGKVLGLTLTSTRRFDLDDDDGVLRVRWNGDRGKRVPGGHFVCAKHGIILDGVENIPTPWRDWLELNKARVGSLIKEL